MKRRPSDSAHRSHGPELVAPSAPAGAAPGLSTHHDKALQRTLYWVSMAMISVIAFEIVAVLTAMPTVTEDLRGGSLYQLAIGISMATQLASLSLAGWWSDRSGPAPVLLGGLGLLVVALIICGLAPSIIVLLIGRAIQGVGSGLSGVAVYVLVGLHVPPLRQPRFFAGFAAAWVIPSMVGPLIAGLIVDHWHWRVVFLSAPVFFALVTPLLVKVLRRTAAAEAGEDNTSDDAAPRLRRREPPSTTLIAATIIAGLACTLLQITASRDTGMSGSTRLILGTGAIVAIGACLPYLLPKGTLRFVHGIPATVATRALMSGYFFAIEIYMPKYLQVTHSWSPSQAGLMLMVGSISWAGGSQIQSRILQPQARRRAAVVGVIILIIGAVGSAICMWSAAPGWLLVPCWFTAGGGMGITYPILPVRALNLAPRAEQGKTSSALTIAEVLGSASAVGLTAAMTSLVFAMTDGPITEVYPMAAGAGAAVASVAALAAVVSVRRAMQD